MQDFELVAKTFQGLEEVLAAELTELGANNIKIGRRMVSFTGNQEMLYRANFELRTAIRVLKTIKHFRAKSAEEVYANVKLVDWSQWLSLGTTFAVDSVVFSDEFRHSKFVAYKVKDAIVDQFRERNGDRPNVRIVNPDIKIHIHVAEYDCTLSLDSSGESLHRRGYRQEAVEAPLNEVLAAGIILQTRWRGECDFIDPMCGSGTLPIEAALIARGISPGVFRKEFAFERWPDFDAELFERVYEDDSRERPFDHHIYAYDINRHACEIATNNVRAAGLSKDISVAQQDFKNFEKPQQKSIMVMNPPYGERISSPDLLGLYKAIGERLKHQFQGNDAWVLSYREECFDQIGLKPSLRTPLFNGSLECELRKYQTFDGRFGQMRAEGGDIKTAAERRIMAEGKRFKQNRATRRNVDEDEDEAQMPFSQRRTFGRDDRRQGGFRGARRQDGFRGERRWGDRPDGGDGRWADRNNRRAGRDDNFRPYHRDDEQSDRFHGPRNFQSDRHEGGFCAREGGFRGGFRGKDGGFHGGRDNRRGPRSRFDKPGFGPGNKRGGFGRGDNFRPFGGKGKGKDKPDNFNRFEDYDDED